MLRRQQHKRVRPWLARNKGEHEHDAHLQALSECTTYVYIKYVVTHAIFLYTETELLGEAKRVVEIALRGEGEGRGDMMICTKSRFELAATPNGHMSRVEGKKGGWKLSHTWDITVDYVLPATTC